MPVICLVQQVSEQMVLAHANDDQARRTLLCLLRHPFVGMGLPIECCINVIIADQLLKAGAAVLHDLFLDCVVIIKTDITIHLFQLV